MPVSINTHTVYTQQYVHTVCTKGKYFYHIYTNRSLLSAQKASVFLLLFLWIISFFFFFYCCSITVFRIFTHHFPLPQPNPPPSVVSTLPLVFVHLFFIVVLENPSPHFLSPLPSSYCQIVLTFSVSGYILFAFFFC